MTSGKPFSFGGDSKSIEIGTTNVVKATYLVRNKKDGEGNDAKLTIRKVDYDNNSLLNGFKFAIFKKDDGWLGYDTTTKKVTFGNSWKNAGKFTTGSGYCNIASYNGEFTLNGLYYGYYYVFEIGTKGEYSLIGQQGCNTSSGDPLFYNEEWMMQDNGVPVNRVLCGSNTWKSGLLDVGMQDGSSYDFRFSDSKEVGSMACVRLANHEGPYEYKYKEVDDETKEETEKIETRYATRHAIYTIKNRKDTELKIRKTDADKKTPIEGVGIKVLLKLKENILYRDNNSIDKIKYPAEQWYWLMLDGSLTQDYTNATTFRTNENGEINCTMVPYGDYYIYETEAIKGYKLEDQEGYKKEKPDDYNLDDNRTNKFFNGEYAELGKKTIIPKSSEKNNVVLNGNYIIRYNNENDYVIDLLDEKNQNQNTRWGVKLYKYAKNNKEDGYSGQTIRISYVEKGYYLLFNDYSKKYITCQSDSNNDNDMKPAIIADSKQSETGPFTFSSQQWEFILTNDGKFNIKTRASAKKQSNLYVKRKDVLEQGNGAQVYLQNPDMYPNNQKFEVNPKTSSYQVPTDETGNRIITFEVENKSAAIELTIRKVDGTYKTDTGSDDDIYLSGAEFKIYGTNFDDNSSPGWITQKNEQGNIKTEYKNYSEATTFTTNNEGKLKITQLKKGEYHIFETKAPNGYDLKSQDGYKDKFSENEISEIPGASEITSQDWVYHDKIITNDIENTLTLFNTKYVSLKGKVWLDNPSGKANSYNSLYDEGDWILQNENIPVNLYYNKGGTNKLIAKTNTGENGEYEFKYVEKEDPMYENHKITTQLTYWEMAYCYVEFIYDNKEYVIANPFVEDNVQINSKAQAKEVITTGGENNMGELYDGNLSGKDTTKAFSGRALTYQGATIGLDFKAIEDNKNVENNQKLLTSFYNNDTYTIEDINLGLTKKIDPTFAIAQEIEYVKIKRGDYTFTYKMRT